MSRIMWVEGEGACSLQNSSQHFDVDLVGGVHFSVYPSHIESNQLPSRILDYASGIRRDLL
jgi:hypothetical protein